MNIVNRSLTLNPNPGNDTWECIAGCRVQLNGFEMAGLAVPFNPGFTLKCYLEGVDVGPDTPLIKFNRNRTFTTVLDILDADDLFRDIVSGDRLDEDSNGADEIRAVFTLVNNSTGASVIRRSGTRQIVA